MDDDEVAGPLENSATLSLSLLFNSSLTGAGRGTKVTRTRMENGGGRRKE